MIKKDINFLENRLLLGILLTAILIFVFYSKSIVNKDKYYTNINSLNKLKEINSRLNGNLFLTQFNKVKHYDLVRKDIIDLLNNSELLKEYTKDVDLKRYQYNLENYLINVQKKDDTLNSLISYFAVYKNFIEYYPKLSNDLSFKFKDKHKELSLNILKLQNKILIYNYNGDKNFIDILKDIENMKNILDIKNRDEIEYFIRYTNLIIENKDKIKILENEFLSINLSEDINKLIENYSYYHDVLESEAKKYTILMMILVVSLFIWILYFIINLNKANKKVNETVNELNFQKSALDEHAIVSITDAKGKITYVNEKFCLISGYKKEELLGKNHRILKSNYHDENFFRTLWQRITNGKTWQGEVKNRKKDGSFYWVSATVVPFLDEEGKPFQYISIRTDITKRKKIEEDLIESKIKADESNKIKGEFLANMSHELRTPLNGVIGMAHIALDNEKNKKQKGYLEKINTSANILLKIINDLLDYSKIEAGKLSCENIEFNIDNLLQSVADLVGVKAYEKDLELYFNRDMEIPKLLIGDSLRIGQILVNIIGNSIKFTNKGEVSLNIKLVNLENNFALIKFVVKDTGIGMDEKTLGNIFNSFTQADSSTTRKYGGTGLGLTITKNLVELMGGNISVESEVNIGTTTTITLPFESVKDTQKVDYSFTKDVLVNLYALSDAILDSMKQILNSLKIDFEVSNSLELKNSANKKVIIISEKEDSFDLCDESSLIYLINPNKTIKSEKENIKILSKPINPSVIYDSIIEFLNLDKNSVSSLVKEKSIKYKNINVLLVEDNEINQLVATTFLETFGCKVFIANNGLEGIDFVKSKDYSFDIIFMDIQMPVMNGYEATKVIREELNLDIPIIAMTANAMKEDIDKAKEIGMNMHIGKPINPNEIEKAIQTFSLKK